MVSSNVTKFVETLLEQVGVTGPPVDLDRLAEFQGVQNVERVSLGAVLGSTTRTGRGFTIRLNSATSPLNERFTYAHEIAHTVLTPLPWNEGGLHIRTSSKGAALERLCDRYAAEILMPRRWAFPAVRKGPIDSIVGLAEIFQISLESAAVRFAQLSGECNGRLRWKSVDEVSEPGWGCGTRPLSACGTALTMPNYATSTEKLDPTLECWHSVMHKECETTLETPLLYESRCYPSGASRYVLTLVRSGDAQLRFKFLKNVRHRECLRGATKERISHGYRPRR